MSSTQEAVDRAIDRGLNYLVDIQESDGHLPSFVAADLEISKERRVDRSVFITQHIAASLLGVDDPRARQVVSRSIAFLEVERWPGGLWKFWTKDHPGRWAIPPDVDDTACVAFLMTCLGRPVAPSCREILLGNRTREGLFRTWILPRSGHLVRPRAWPAVVHLVLHPLQVRAFFRQGGSRPGDLDAVVMANVVLFLGANPDTFATIKWLHQVIRSGSEAESDRYYLSPLPLYYAVARCLRAGCNAFESLKPIIIERIRHLIQRDHSTLNSLYMALNATVLREWAVEVPEYGIALTKILARQLEDGSWPAHGFFFGDDTRNIAFGSEALTTGFCLEALNLARVHRIATA